jgi:hypothetical protein
MATSCAIALEPYASHIWEARVDEFVRQSALNSGSRPSKDQMRAAWAIEPKRFGAQDRRSPAGSETVGGPAGCSDLGPCR